MNPDLANAWGNGTAEPIFWTTTRFEINVHPLVFIVSINGSEPMAHIILRHLLRYPGPFYSFSGKITGRNRNITRADYGTLVMSKKNTFV